MKPKPKPKPKPRETETETETNRVYAQPDFRKFSEMTAAGFGLFRNIWGRNWKTVFLFLKTMIFREMFRRTPISLFRRIRQSQTYIINGVANSLNRMANSMNRVAKSY
jgi:hypothetical protein